ncbi:sodium/hydrogen exchanger 3-like isoform X2 [Syzygium oleosum]|uniref:sodium/hydrogen exchanger 3-like isoform X2 n=1 Tax=Syzygium oleosum TaxID=219896 RepID=UPI0024B8F2E8|nr:sodium/hydrogen exchanger 3-like isoform X2 [Syzygium oleosum]XP_056162368.1 sodium/hydrogen exchanger 3-like isoform X2 [Syzygium oleosum]
MWLFLQDSPQWDVPKQSARFIPKSARKTKKIHTSHPTPSSLNLARDSCCRYSVNSTYLISQGVQNLHSSMIWKLTWKSLTDEVIKCFFGEGLLSWKSIKVSSTLLGFVLIGRATFVFPLLFLSNLVRKSKYEKIDLEQQVTIWWAELMHGAVSMALAYHQFTQSDTKLKGNVFMIARTITVILFSPVLGPLTKPLV